MCAFTTFLPCPPFPKVPKLHQATIHASTPAPTFPRRTILKLAPLLLLPTQTSARATKPLSASLAPLINLQETLSTLVTEIEQGTNADIRRVVKTLLIASDIPNNLRDAVTALPKQRRETVLASGREAYEYLSQVVEYYDPVDSRGRATGDVMAFCLEAVRRAEEILRDVIGEFDAV